MRAPVPAGRWPRSRGRRYRGAAGRQWRRQDQPVRDDPGFPGVGETCSSVRTRRDGLAGRAARAGRYRLCAGRASRLRGPHGAREPRSLFVAGARRAATSRRGNADDVPHARRTARGARLAAVGRPAADAGIGARADEPAASAVAGRADPRSRATGGQSIYSAGSVPWRRRAWRFWWGSSAQGSCFVSPSADSF